MFRLLEWFARIGKNIHRQKIKTYLKAHQASRGVTDTMLFGAQIFGRIPPFVEIETTNLVVGKAYIF
jgi:hypothetical protein